MSFTVKIGKKRYEVKTVEQAVRLFLTKGDMDEEHLHYK